MIPDTDSFTAKSANRYMDVPYLGNAGAAAKSTKFFILRVLSALRGEI